jgi:hypothetical protein
MNYGERPRQAAARISKLPQVEWKEEILKYPNKDLHELIRAHLKDVVSRAKFARG